MDRIHLIDNKEKQFIWFSDPGQSALAHVMNVGEEPVIVDPQAAVVGNNDVTLGKFESVTIAGHKISVEPKTAKNPFSVVYVFLEPMGP